MTRRRSQASDIATATAASEQEAPAGTEPKATADSYTSAPASAPKTLGPGDIVSALIDSLGPHSTDDINRARDETMKQFLAQTLASRAIAQKYNILILHDEGRMVRGDADNIYSAVTAFSERKPILLVLYSTGGAIASAYLIGKLCRESAQGGFTVVVPRQAKSAATLICCAADEVHMGSLSELGPIDPQIDELPALGLKNSVEHLADLVKQYPAASDMFAKYLSLSLKPIHLGYYERVAESAMQYAERLLRMHQGNLRGKPGDIAHDLVYAYKDHAFVIDKGEAEEIFGPGIVKTGTPEYDLGNAIYQMMSLVSRIADIMKHYFYFIGAPDSKPNFQRKGS